ncbi:MAG: class I SAM-dependent methyltransferase [Acidobacteriia bacterium]|nr:class I SAM-dependent methyltransferase [Terriglobia bacterium]
MFATVAPRYDLLNHVLSLGFDIAWRRATARALREILKRPGSCVADLCCGTGDLSLYLRRQSAGLVVGADFCRPMLTLARRKAAACGGHIHFLEADALSLPFRDESLDAVTVAFGFRNLANYHRGVEEMRRVLKSGGCLAILEFSRVRGRVFGPIFRFYFRRVLPRLGTWVSGVAGPYRYLPDSVSVFPDQDSLAATIRAARFRNVSYVNFTGGVAALHLGEKA